MNKCFIPIFILALCACIGLGPKPALAKLPNVIKHAEGDIRYTFGYWPVVVIGGGALTAGLLSLKDHSFQNNFKTRHLGRFDTVAKYFGEYYVLDPAAFLLFGAGKLFHNEELVVTGETLVESLLFTQAMTGVLKLGFNRTRPNGGNYSFPSGHAANTFAVATVLETLYGLKAGIPGYLAAGLVSYSRLDANDHFLSDLVFGAALGSAIGWGTAHFHKMKNPNLYVLPMIGASKGLSFVYNFK
ncbi:MAG: phosphatase PAP2 family protein [Deltaproteobacteria bacterium]|nr:phosphatase PAP2 family protein [Deltaproteobacteria bacterium]